MSLSRPVRVAAQLHPQHGPFSGLRTAALEAEDSGFDIVYTWDHFFPYTVTATAPTMSAGPRSPRSPRPPTGSR